MDHTGSGSDKGPHGREPEASDPASDRASDRSIPPTSNPKNVSNRSDASDQATVIDAAAVRPGNAAPGRNDAAETVLNAKPLASPPRHDPDATVIDARPVRSGDGPVRNDAAETVLNAKPLRHDPDATVVDARPFDPQATLVDADATIAPGTRPSAPRSRSISDSYGSAAVLQIGDLLGDRYEILQLLGEGGMGAVYKAADRELDRFVALKVIRPELASNPAILARFKQELLLSHQVTHRNVIRIYDLGEAQGVKFITMEFIEGRDLREHHPGEKEVQARGSGRCDSAGLPRAGSGP